MPNTSNASVKLGESDTLVDSSLLSKNSQEDIIASNTENNQNTSNILKKFNLADLIDDNDESLLNISDGILGELDCSI